MSATAQGSASDSNVDSALDNLIFEAAFANTRSPSLSLPWETGILGQIFGNEDPFLATELPHILTMDSSGNDVATASSSTRKRARASEIAGYAKVIKSIPDADFVEATETRWTRALALWLSLLEGCDLQTSVGEHVYSMLVEGRRTKALDILRDCFGTKSPHTVLKRGRDLARFVTWCNSEREKWWPITERLLLRYLDKCKKDGASLSTGKELASAIRFFKFVLGAEIVLESVITPLFTGKSKRMRSQRKPKKQARALTVDEILRLEDLVCNAQDPLDKYFSGCLLFAALGRCRWSDLDHLESLEFDYEVLECGIFGYVESRTNILKTGTSDEKKALYMPLVAPVSASGGKPWALEWLKALGEVGFRRDSIPVGALCRPPSGDGLAKRPLDSGEATELLNMYLGYDNDHDKRTTSHSLKATTWVWASRYGMEENARTLLGHHALPGDSLACYSRDMLSRPLRLMDEMMSSIRAGRFKPDLTRAGWLSQAQSMREEYSQAMSQEHSRYSSWQEVEPRSEEVPGGDTEIWESPDEKNHYNFWNMEPWGEDDVEYEPSVIGDEVAAPKESIGEEDGDCPPEKSVDLPGEASSSSSSSSSSESDGGINEEKFSASQRAMTSSIKMRGLMEKLCCRIRLQECYTGLGAARLPKPYAVSTFPQILLCLRADQDFLGQDVQGALKES